jgi:hypothetical protein
MIARSWTSSNLAEIHKLFRNPHLCVILFQPPALREETLRYVSQRLSGLLSDAESELPVFVEANTMADEIRVHVVHRKGTNLYLRYTDPVTGKRHEKNSGTRSQRKAREAAGEWKAELKAAGTGKALVVHWDDFKEDFEQNYLGDLSEGYTLNVLNTFGVIDATMKPDKLTRVTTAWVKRFKTLMVKAKKPEATIHKYLQHLKTALKWACDQEYIREVPRFPAQKRNAAKGKKHMKGRPITLEEFERMQAACEYPSLNYLMTWLWLSGLRIGEATRRTVRRSFILLSMTSQTSC